MAKPQVVVAPVLMSKLSVNAPEFYPSSYSNYTESYEDGCEVSLASLCTDLSIVNASILCLSRENFFPPFQRLAVKKIYVTFKRLISNLPFQMPF